jgi:hypothetical protein
MHDNPRAAMGGVVAVLVAALFLIVARLGDDASGAAYNYGFYYDLSTRELFVDSNRQLPPIRDGQGVAAHVFSCGQCEDKASRVIGWLEMYTPEAKAALAAPQTGSPDDFAVAEIVVDPVVEAGHLYAFEPQAGAEPQWVPANSLPASRIQQQALAMCDGRRANPCSPDSDDLP